MAVCQRSGRDGRRRSLSWCSAGRQAVSHADFQQASLSHQYRALKEVRMDFQFTDEQTARRKEFFQVCSELEEVRPAEFVGVEALYNFDSCWEYDRRCAKEFAKRGWLTLHWPAEYGGSGTMMDRVLFSEARGYHGIPGVDVFGVGMLAPTLLAAASEEVKREFLPPIAAAEVTWCELWSEPNAGSDLASLTATAMKKGDNTS